MGREACSPDKLGFFLTLYVYTATVEKWEGDSPRDKLKSNRKKKVYKGKRRHYL